MLYRVQSTALGQSGNTLVLLPFAQVTVRDKNGDLARIFADEGEVVEYPNPMTATASGGFDFFVELDDYYDIITSSNGQSISDRIYPIDPASIIADAEASSKVWADAAEADALATAADRVQTEADAVATAADRVQTGLDATATAADRVQTGLDATATAADRVQTGLDATATAADRVQTGLDAASAEASATEAALYDGPKVDTFAEVAGVTAAMVGVGEVLRVIGTNGLLLRVASGGDTAGDGISFADLSKATAQSFEHWAAQPEGTTFTIEGVAYKVKAGGTVATALGVPGIINVFGGPRPLEHFNSSDTRLGSGNAVVDRAALQSGLNSEYAVDLAGLKLKVADTIDVSEIEPCLTSSIPSQRNGSGNAIRAAQIEVTDNALPILFHVSTYNSRFSNFRVKCDPANVATEHFKFQRSPAGPSDVDADLSDITAEYGQRVVNTLGRGLRFDDCETVGTSDYAIRLDWDGAWVPNGQSNDEFSEQAPVN